MATPIKTAKGTWRIQIEVKGQRDSNTLPTKREATEWAARRSAELLATATGRAGEVKTLGQALVRYGEEVSSEKKGWQKELIRLQAFPRQPLFPAKRLLAELTPADIVAWRDARLKVNARSSVLRDMVLLSHVLEVARRDWQWLNSNPMRDVRKPSEPDHRERIISGPEVRRMLRALGWSRGPVRSVGGRGVFPPPPPPPPPPHAPCPAPACAGPVQDVRVDQHHPRAGVLQPQGRRHRPAHHGWRCSHSITSLSSHLPSRPGRGKSLYFSMRLRSVLRHTPNRSASWARSRRVPSMLAISVMALTIFSIFSASWAASLMACLLGCCAW